MNNTGINYHRIENINVHNYLINFYDNVVVYTQPIDVDMKYMFRYMVCAYDPYIRYTFRDSIIN